MDICEVVENLGRLITGHNPKVMSTRDICHAAIRRENAPDELEAKAKRKDREGALSDEEEKPKKKRKH